MTRVTCRLTAKNRDQHRNSALGNRVWATFTFLKNFIKLFTFGNIFYVVADERRANNDSLRDTYLLRYFLLSCQGIVAVPGGAGGFLLGGFIIKRMSLTIVQQLRGMFVMGIVGVCAMLMFCVQCDYAPLADTTVHQHPEHANRLVLDDNRY